MKRSCGNPAYCVSESGLFPIMDSKQSNKDGKKRKRFESKDYGSQTHPSGSSNYSDRLDTRVVTASQASVGSETESCVAKTSGINIHAKVQIFK